MNVLATKRVAAVRRPETSDARERGGSRSGPTPQGLAATTFLIFVFGLAAAGLFFLQ